MQHVFLASTKGIPCLSAMHIVTVTRYGSKMFKTGLYCLGLLLFVSFAAAERKEDQHFPRKNGVLILDDHCFFAALLKYKFVLVFYYDKSKESNSAAEFIPKIEAKLLAENPDVHVATLDAEKHSESLRKFPVYEMPAFRLFKNGRKFDYHGTKTVEHILTWINLAMNVPIQINIPKELDDLRETTCVIVGCFPGGKPEDAMVNFKKVSEYFVYDPRMMLPRFAVVTSASIARSLSLSSGSVTVFKKFEDGEKSVYDGDATYFDKLLKFVEEETTPVVLKHDQVGYNSRLHDSTIEYHHILFYSSKDRNYRQTFNNFKQAAKKYQQKDSKVLFVHVDSSHERISQYVGFYHVDPDKDLPCNRMTKIDKYHSRFVPSKKDFSTEAFVRFTDDVMNGKVQRNIRSDPSPADWNNYDVKIIVGSTYDKFIRDEKRVVFMIYYVLDNDACSTALGVFNQLAREMRSNQTLLFGKMDVATNDGEIDVHVTYPTFKLFRTNGEVTKYRGDVNLGAMKAFIETGGVTHMGNPDEHHGGAEYDFSWHDKAHPVDDWRDEEERKKKWAEEEKEFLEKAVEHQVGEEPHDNPKYKEEHPLHHLDPDERDPEHMDPKKHADFENHPYQDEVVEHHHEL